MNQIRSLLDTAPDAIRSKYRNLTTLALITKLHRQRPSSDLGSPDAAASLGLKELAHRWKVLNDQIGRLDVHLDRLVNQTAPNLTTAFGVGTITAAALLICAGDNPDRLGSSAAFAALCGVSPIPASSGKTSNRHRLNRGGNRQANAALWRIAMTRLAYDPRTQTYAQRRTTEGLSKREIIRCLKRAIARELYPIITADLDHARR